MRSVAHVGENLAGYSGATAPELHRTSLKPAPLSEIFVQQVASLLFYTTV
jgi:hypothetical protein